MPIYRISLFHESSDTEGWSENFYWSGSSINAAQSEMDSLISERVALFGPAFRMVDGRVSDVTMRGNTLFTTHTLPVAGTYVPTSGAVALEANTALMCKMIAVLPRFMRIFLRGLYSDIIHGREYVAPGTWDIALRVLLNRLISNNYQARHRLTPPPHATYNYSPISSIGDLIASARKPGRPFDLLRGRRTVPE